jgi:BR serine/threonine kinase
MVRVGRWLVGDKIEKGASGTVVKGEDTVTGDFVALKRIPLDMVDEKVRREVAVLRVVRHPNIIRFITTVENPWFLYIVQELAQVQTLLEYLLAFGGDGMPLDQAMVFFRQIIAGLSYLHKRSICRRDLKLENILMGLDNQAKISDFGCARLLPAEKAVTKDVGSPGWHPPEVLDDGDYLGQAADIWCAGLILYTLVAGLMPPESMKDGRMLADWRHDIPTWFTPELIDLLSHMLDEIPQSRWTVDQIMGHSLFGAYEVDESADDAPLGMIPRVREFEETVAMLGYRSVEQVRQDLNSDSNTPAKQFARLWIQAE